MTGIGAGPLSGTRVIDLAGQGPGRFCGMLLADMGAEVLRIMPPSGRDGRQIAGLGSTEGSVVGRGRTMIKLDLKSEAGRAEFLNLSTLADLILEGFRPGTMERLRLGPDDLFSVNKRLVYGRFTGYGQTGVLAQNAGHDINFVAQSGVLSLLGNAGAPQPPLNLLGDYGVVPSVHSEWCAHCSGRGWMVSDRSST